MTQGRFARLTAALCPQEPGRQTPGDYARRGIAGPNPSTIAVRWTEINRLGGPGGEEKNDPPPQCRGDAFLRARYHKGGDLDPRLCDPPPARQAARRSGYTRGRSLSIRHPTGNVSAPQNSSIDSTNMVEDRVRQPAKASPTGTLEATGDLSNRTSSLRPRQGAILFTPGKGGTGWDLDCGCWKGTVPKWPLAGRRVARSGMEESAWQVDFLAPRRETKGCIRCPERVPAEAIWEIPG